MIVATQNNSSNNYTTNNYALGKDETATTIMIALPNTNQDRQQHVEQQ
jgi:hypothetical protein